MLLGEIYVYAIIIGVFVFVFGFLIYEIVGLFKTRRAMNQVMINLSESINDVDTYRLNGDLENRKTIERLVAENNELKKKLEDAKQN